MSFRNAAQKSAHDYYDFLSEHDKSTVTYHIHDILPFHDSHNKNTDIYWLVLERALKSIEGLNIQIDGKIYNETQIKPLSFDENNNYLKVSLAPEYKDIFQSIDISKVTVVVDLKFLVKRVEDWYLRYGDRIQLPTQTSSVTYYPLPKLLPPSEDQRATIEGVLSVPFSYVWGAPGTGKTKCVLSQTVLTYLREKKKILVVAPTNNAVEQTLYGLIEQMTHAGYSQKDVDELVVRMGMATPAFMKRYPNICENTKLENQIQKYQNEESELKTQLSNYEQQINYYKKCKAQLSQLQQQKAVAETTAVITENDLIKIEALFKQQYLNEEDKSKNSKLIEVTKAEIRSLTSIIQYTKDSIDALLKKQASPLGRFSAKLHRQNIKKELDLALQNRKHYETQLSAAVESQNICMQQSHEIDVRLHQGEKDFESALNQLACHLAFIPGILNTIHTLSKQNASIFKSAIRKAIQNYISDNEHEQTQLSEQLNHNTIEALQQSYEQMQFALLNTRAALESLSINGISKRIEKCLVVATTVDTCLARLTPDSDQRFSHVFLDEAGYCSLIKAVPLTAYQCPVTFLGDHMQLQPVCTASDEVITRKKEICLWALSALYTEDALCMSMRSIFEKYNQHLMPGFDITQKYDLLFSHRFGEALARVLAGKVYSSEFKGNKDKETKIYYVNAPKIQTGKRESIIEAESIFTMLKNKKSTKTIGIITPYKNQVKLLHNKRPQLHQKTISADDIMTVHQSQGREWDCVILSVVDTSDMWFTNSNYDFGKQTINTAVSRAKDSLIIVCDYEFWIKQNHQLITDLLSIAKPL